MVASRAENRFRLLKSRDFCYCVFLKLRIHHHEGSSFKVKHIDRHFGQGRASFSLKGRRVPTVGNICMDMCMLDVTGVDARVGDTVTIFGEDPTVSELAGILGTIPYEIFTSVPRRIERIVVRH